ncbi:Transcriptional regulatory protein ZraR [Planctomycetes bacterium Pan216]|uniref:DNA-binding transcriptional regulator NtrC n=1 Tax=Kolteria novifilia TaxID=2527975 RepID=A0A518BAD7_9BACT|nr:Transcriptional regulatory protein ZraR [Planctomycetes bacterium Pan216]
MKQNDDACDVLIVDDEHAVCWSLSRALASEGRKTETAASAEQAIERCRQTPPRAILLDVRLPGMDGLTAMDSFRELAPRVPIIVMTAYGQLSTAVSAIEKGAFDYLTKPFDLDDALKSVKLALDTAEHGNLSSPTSSQGFESLLGQSAPMQEVFKRIALAAQSDATVLITGESGVGKDLVAQAIHRHGRRGNKPFVPVHVGALSPSLVESELFGHVKGAFTGASDHREGLISLADGGTLFLDEVAEIPPLVQVKLLRLLEQREVMPVGSGRVTHPDVRILAATHQDLARLVEEGTFRRDLYYRLRVFDIEIPPLRDRREDIPLLADHFLSQITPRVSHVSEEVYAHLLKGPWIGNVRELRNALESAALVARGGPLLPDHFSEHSRPTSRGSVDSLPHAVRAWLRELLAQEELPPRDLYDRLLAQVEPALLEETLRRVDGSRQEAANWLGLNRTTVRKKLNRYGVE